MITAHLGKVSAGEDLTQEEMTEVIDWLLRGEAKENEIALLLTALHTKGETADEIAGAARAMRLHMTPLVATRGPILDTCGTGGVGSQLFNISTAAAIVVAAAGVAVAKHGNRSVTSKSGSADVLKLLGVNIDAPVNIVQECLDELGICFCFAPLFHPAMKHVAPVRKQLGTATIFNLLGPLCNPASATVQLIGVGKRELHGTIADAIGKLGTQRAVIAHGADGIGEVSLSAATEIIEVQPQSRSTGQWTPADFGLSTAPREALTIQSAQQSAETIIKVLGGEKGPPRDATVLNAAAALWIAGIDRDPRACAARAAEAIDSGAARRLLARWWQKTNRK